ncbi:MAG TPA: class I SAM-dependent methyltransferase [Ignavibacteria bacterium]|nr:class I SAM-dependent methyltransferase [Ignavibacteria bacterium]HMR39854.1 class I SAM-dependent methyltransferase [Ignavibacteria bacterium]
MPEKIKSYLLYNANQNNENSVSERSRKKRSDFFREFCIKLNMPFPLSILDLGGSDYHWRRSGFVNNKDFQITMVNTEDQDLSGMDNFIYLKKDVTDLGNFSDEEFDIVYSNSLIEHINTEDLQFKLAEDIRRIGKHYFIQTPNYYFPLEPHFLFPFFQYLPVNVRAGLVKNFDLGWYDKQPDKEKALELASSIKLLSQKELKKLFPDGNIYHEKYLFLNKSFIIYK